MRSGVVAAQVRLHLDDPGSHRQRRAPVDAEPSPEQVAGDLERGPAKEVRLDVCSLSLLGGVGAVVGSGYRRTSARQRTRRAVAMVS